MDVMPCTNSKRNILVLGDGDLSYSTTLMCDKDASLTATVYLSKDELLSTYGESVEKNIAMLNQNAADVLFSVDARNLSGKVIEKCYDDVHFNFPHTGGKGKISENKLLLKDCFKNILKILNPSGNVEIALTPGQGGTPADGSKLRSKGNTWNIQDAAAESGFILYKVVEFTADYNLSGYRSTSKSFFCNKGLKHCFVHRPFVANPIAATLLSLPSESLLQKYLNKHGIDSSHLRVEPGPMVGSFNDLVILKIVSDHDQENDAPAVKRGKYCDDLAATIIDDLGITDKKLLFFPADKIEVAYPPYYTHDVSMWTDSKISPNITNILIKCAGLSLHEVSKREEFYLDPKTGRYSHCFSVTYSHPFEALSEKYVKYLAHTLIRDNLAQAGFELH